MISGPTNAIRQCCPGTIVKFIGDANLALRSRWESVGNKLLEVQVLRTFLATASCAAITMAAISAPAWAIDGTFSALDGAWSGSGSVKLENGKTERLKCKGYYNAKTGNSLGMAINCGNASFKINMRAALKSAGGAISGTWEEREFNQTGDVNGKQTANGFSLKFTGAISGSMNVTMTGARQSVSISTGGPGFTGVNLSFGKNG